LTSGREAASAVDDLFTEDIDSDGWSASFGSQRRPLVFTKEFIDGLPRDPIEAAHQMCQAVFERREDLGRDQDYGAPRDLTFEDCIEIVAAFEALAERYGLDLVLPDVSVGGRDDFFRATTDFVDSLYKQVDKKVAESRMRRAREEYRGMFGAGAPFELTDGDVEEIQRMLNRLRDIIVKTNNLTEKHKQRVLERLEALQAELHKRMSSVDKFWAFLGEATVIARKLGKEGKPLLDITLLILKIIHSAQARAAGLPSATEFPLLPPPDDKNEDDDLPPRDRGTTAGAPGSV
jgi:hypothetical protein